MLRAAGLRAISPRDLRVAFITLMALAAFAGACGLTQSAVFHQPTTLKYAVTIGGPLVLLVAAAWDEPLQVLVPALIVVAPFGGFVMTVGGFHVSALVVLIFASTVAAIVAGPPPMRLSRTGIALATAIPLLAVPLVTGSSGKAIATVIAAMVLTGWIVSRTARTPLGLRIVVASFLVSAAVQAAIAVWEYRTGRLLDLYGAAGNQVFGADYFFGYGTTNRPTGAFYDPVSLGNVLSLGCPMALSCVVATRSLTARVGAGALALLVGVGMVLTLSRESWIGAAVGLVAAIVFMAPSARARAVVPAFIAVVVIAVVAVNSSGGVLGQRFESIFHPTATGVRTASGDRAREETWSTALAVAAQHPIFGTGFGNLLPVLENTVPGSNASSNAQSVYLQVLAEAGGVGALALLLVMASLTRDLAAGLKGSERTLVAGAAGAFVSLLICWLTDYTIRYVAVAVMIAVLLGVIASQARVGRPDGA